jgi:hypothetical protein
MNAPAIKTHWKSLAHDDRYIGAHSLPNGEDMTVTIVRIEEQLNVQMGGGKKEDLCVAHLAECKPMILNITNRETLAELFKTNWVEEWVGRRFTLYASRTKLGPKMVDCLRIRPKLPSDTKPVLPEARMVAALAAVTKGTFTADKLRGDYALTPDQLARLAAVEAELAAPVQEPDQAAAGEPGVDPEAA